MVLQLVRSKIEPILRTPCAFWNMSRRFFHFTRMEEGKKFLPERLEDLDHECWAGLINLLDKRIRYNWELFASRVYSSRREFSSFKGAKAFLNDWSSKENGNVTRLIEICQEFDRFDIIILLRKIHIFG